MFVHGIEQSINQAVIQQKLLASLSADPVKTLTMIRDPKDLLELEYLPLQEFKENEKEELLLKITKATEVGLSWSHEAQRIYLEKEILSQKIENEWLKKILEDKETKIIIFDMLLYGKYILKASPSSIGEELSLKYIAQFKEKSQLLFEKIKNIPEFIKAIKETGGYFRILLLVYTEILAHDKLLHEFRAAEFVGHNVAYQVAKNEDKFNQLRITDKSGKLLEEYTIREIRIIKNGKRDKALKGIILISSCIKEESFPTLYISWAGTHGSASMSADFERNPGEESYRLGEDQILKQVISVIEEIGKPIKIVICGHSLGGALSQLLFHSLQRVLAAQLKEEAEKIQTLEEKFQTELYKLSPHQQDLSEIKLDPTMIKEMSADVWNSAGVLLPIVDHSNELSHILVKAGIQQYANFGFVDGDVLQSTGQGSILSKVHENGAKIKILKVESGITKTFMAALGASTVIPAGLGIAGSSNPIGWVASLICLGAMYAQAFTNTKEAHTKHHFKTSVRPQQGYTIFSSHKGDGSINSEECKRIQEQLTIKSASLVDNGIHLISQAYMQDDRYKSELSKAILADKKKYHKTAEKTFAFMVTRIKSRDVYDEKRMINTCKENLIDDVLTMQDNQGKTLLHHAIENEKYNFAMALLENERTSVLQLDNDGNFPLLTFMLKINNSIYQLQETYNFGIKLLAMTHIDLSIKNKKNESVENVYNSWYWSGYNAKQFALELAKRIPLRLMQLPLSKEDAKPPEMLKMI